MRLLRLWNYNGDRQRFVNLDLLVDAEWEPDKKRLTMIFAGREYPIVLDGDAAVNARQMLGALLAASEVVPDTIKVHEDEE